jgi:hypothetical protein
MSMWKFVINGTEVEEPLKWNESKKIVNRSKKYRALFVEYVADLTFHGNGYRKLKDIIANGAISAFTNRPGALRSGDVRSGYCSEIPFEIYKRCSEFEDFKTFFYGIITLSEMEEDEENCTITVNAEDNTLSRLLTDRGDLKVNTTATKSVNETALTTPASFKLTAIYDWDNTDYKERYTIKVSDYFQFILDYISNQSITFESKLLTSNPTKSSAFVNDGSVFAELAGRFQFTVTFLNPTVDLVGSGNITIKYTNPFSQVITLTVPKQGTVAATLNYMIYMFNNDTSGSSKIIRFYNQGCKYPADVTTNGTDNLVIKSDFYFTIEEISGAPYTITTIEPESSELYGYEYGAGSLKNLVIAKGALIRGSLSQPAFSWSMSFNELFTELNKICNLGMSLTYSNGQATLTVDQLYTFNHQSNNITLTNVKKLKYKIRKGDLFDSLNTEEGSDGVGVTGIFTSPLNFMVLDTCSKNELDLKNKFITDWDDITSLLGHTQGDRDEEIVLIECIPASGQGPGVELESRIYDYIIYSNASGASIIAEVMNVRLCNFRKVINWLPNIKGSPSFQEGTINNFAEILLKEYSFEYPLTHEQWEQIEQGYLNYVEFGAGNKADKQGWIESLQYNCKTGKTLFKLLTT